MQVSHSTINFPSRCLPASPQGRGTAHSGKIFIKFAVLLPWDEQVCWGTFVAFHVKHVRARPTRALFEFNIIHRHPRPRKTVAKEPDRSANFLEEIRQIEPLRLEVQIQAQHGRNHVFIPVKFFGVPAYVCAELMPGFSRKKSPSYAGPVVLNLHGTDSGSML